MIVTLAFVGYAVWGLVVGRFVFADCQKHSILQLQQEMREASANPKHPRRMLYAKMTEDELFEAAYEKIKDHGADLLAGIAAGIFWPVFICLLVIGGSYLLTAKGVTALMPKTSVEKRMAAIKLKRERAQQWEKAIKQLEDSGVDTKELREMKFE